MVVVLEPPGVPVRLPPLGSLPRSCSKPSTAPAASEGTASPSAPRRPGTADSSLGTAAPGPWDVSIPQEPGGSKELAVPAEPR